MTQAPASQGRYKSKQVKSHAENNLFHKVVRDSCKMPQECKIYPEKQENAETYIPTTTTTYFNKAKHTAPQVE